MPFVQALRQCQRGLGRKPEAAVGLALQRGQVKQARRRLGFGRGLLGDTGGATAHRVGDSLGLRLGPDAFGLELRVFLGFFPLGVEPFTWVDARLRRKGGVDFPIVAADEFTNLFFALDHHGQGGRLHPTDGGQKKAAVA